MSATILSSPPPWDPDAYDREVRAERRRTKPLTLRKRPEGTGANTFDYDGSGRGLASEVELARRAAMDKAMRRRQTRTKGASAPRQLRNGRWEARRHINGTRHMRRFDTRAEAQAWLDSLGED